MIKFLITFSIGGLFGLFIACALQAGREYEKDKEIERLNNIINELEDLITIKIVRASNEEDYDIEIDDMIELKN